ncbi:SH3 domain-containing protein [Ancylothrix sp. C2]|uniref:SH3 domain-containing protein n=1 Tax=Ancylothrix sp. D3o TaxID=2953691 RepID=UPI0021BB22AF|nr:SH3 domain-containing protein [Ancylothrix sp. D3o]MCT7949788.1 SH3 domain-containing protein [Ancylothrix sp. D3o]
MKTYQNSKNSLKLTWITLCAGLLTVACTPTQTPTTQAPSQPSPIASTPAPPTPVATPVAKTPTQTPPKQAPASIPLKTTKPQECKITNAKIADPNPPANVRSSPEVKPDNIVGKVENGRIVGVLAEQNNWLQISEPQGWISKTITETECSEKTETISLTSNSNSKTINGRFIGTGSHTYLFTAKEGQTLTVAVQEGPLPFIISPDQKELTGGGDYTGKKSWTGKLPASGEYKIQFESNFRGYNYNTTVELQ